MHLLTESQAEQCHFSLKLRCNYVIETSDISRVCVKGECHSNHMLFSYPWGVPYGSVTVIHFTTKNYEPYSMLWTHTV